jgi:hypothetical protein
LSGSGFVATGSDHRIGFLLDINTLSIPTGEQITELLRINNAGGDKRFTFDLIEDSGIKVQAIAWQVTTFTPSTVVTSALSAGLVTIEAHVTTTSIELFVNGISVGSDTGTNIGLSNSTNIILTPGATAATPSGVFYVDDINVRNDDTEIFPASDENSFRFMGLAADGTHLIITGLKDNATLTAFRFDLADLAESGTVTFGSATNTEVDAGTRFIAPVWSYGNDGKWLIYGRDGNNVQAQVNATAGTGSYADIGAGTATWDTTKVAVALMPAALGSNDLIITFSDDDIYRSIDDGTTWIKQGDAGAALAYGRRDAIHDSRLMVGGTASGTVLYSHNYGQSFADRSGTVLDGIVQSIAVSYDL